MSLGAIRRLPVAGLAATDAHLWLWVTNAVLPVTAEVMVAWGFYYRSCLTWIKPRLGLGNYLRNQTEHLLLGVRGRAPIRFRAQGSWLYAGTGAQPQAGGAVRRHRALLGRPVSRIVARRRRPGWAAWGNEVESDVTLW